jgi:hypothetical protein
MADDGILFVNIGDTYITRPCGGIGQSTINGKGSHEALREASSKLTRMRRTGLKLKDMALVPERWRSRCRTMGGGCAAGSSGTRRTRCRRACATASRWRTSTSGCWRSLSATSSTAAPFRSRRARTRTRG